eukprot:TRINITY_DN11673_c0_g1_i1.p1 TRINITY_DN11673_c0_g1~~TRINITY_DN11673_c0_g1_i1.p1  ORF type:complete len:770 (+),score=180.59 TRINITY_DN11673_c0_g1_i1:85-2310(+)
MDTVGGFALKVCIGRGCFGVVWSAVCPESGELRALKQIDVSFLSEKERELCVTEVQVLARLAELRCPYVIRYHSSFVEGTALCVVTELAPGGSLYDRIRGDPEAGGTPGMSSAAVWRAFTEVLVGLHAVHGAGVLHRDLKTLNIFIAAGGACRIGDFGLARVLSNPRSLARTMVGTPYYISPEMCAGQEYGPKSDVWALGIVLHELCTARFPFEAPNHAALVLQIARARVDTLFRIRDTHGPTLAGLVKRCLTKHTNHRPSTADLLGTQSVVDAALRHHVAVPPAFVAAARRRVCNQIRAHPVASLSSLTALCSDAAEAGAGPAAAAAAVDSATTAAAAAALRLSEREAAALLQDGARPAPGSAPRATPTAQQPRGGLPSRRVRRGGPQRRGDYCPPPSRSRPVPPPRQKTAQTGYRSGKARSRDIGLVAALPEPGAGSSGSDDDSADSDAPRQHCSPPRYNRAAGAWRGSPKRGGEAPARDRCGQPSAPFPGADRPSAEGAHGAPAPRAATPQSAGSGAVGSEGEDADGGGRLSNTDADDEYASSVTVRWTVRGATGEEQSGLAATAVPAASGSRAPWRPEDDADGAAAGAGPGADQGPETDAEEDGAYSSDGRAADSDAAAGDYWSSGSGADAGDHTAGDSLQRRAARLQQQLCDCAELYKDAEARLPPGAVELLRESARAAGRFPDGSAAAVSTPDVQWGDSDFGDAHSARAVCLVYRKLLLEAELRAVEECTAESPT